MKLFKMLHLLEEKEKKMFSSFINASVFNQRKDVVLLLDHLILNNIHRPNPEILWNQIYSNEKFSASKWHLLTSRLFKLLEDFLAHNQLRKDAISKSFYLAKAYRNLGEKKSFEKTIRANQKLLKKQNLRDINYLQRMHDLAYEKYDFILSVSRKEKSNLQEVSDNLDAYFMATKLRQACYALSRSIIQQEDYEINFITDILKLIEENSHFLEIPAIAIYYNCYRSISEHDNEKYFIELRKNIDEFLPHFSSTEMRDIYTIAINYSIRQINTGADHYIREAFELYLLSLKQGFLTDKGIMQNSTYTNLVSLACNLKRFDWAKDFIEKYRSNLSPIKQTALYHYTLGKLYYEQGLPDQSLPNLALVDGKDSFIFLGARILQMKIYFEQKEFDPLESLLESLRVYLQRSKNLAYRKAHYTNTISFTRQLLLVPKMTKAEKEELREKILQTEVFGEKEWLLNAID